MNHRFSRYIYSILAFAVLVSCSSERFIPEGGYLLDRVSVSTDEPVLKAAGLEGYIKQHPNSKWFGVTKVPMGMYLMQGSDTTKWFNRFVRRRGEKPEIFNEKLAEYTADEITRAAQGLGYRNAEVETKTTVKKHKISVDYDINAGPRWYVSDIGMQFPDSLMQAIYESTRVMSHLKRGMPFDVNILDKERSRIVSLYQNNGYYKFNRSHVHFLADTVSLPRQVDLTLQVLPYRETEKDAPMPHTQFRYGDVTFEGDGSKKIWHSVLDEANQIRSDELYTEQSVQQTYARLSRLGNVINSATHFTVRDSSYLDTRLVVNTSKTHSLQLSPEATNTAGDAGAALGLTYQNRNFFKGGETFSVKLRGAYEAVKGLEGYSNEGFYEYSAEATLAWPSFQFPFIGATRRHSSLATTEFGVMYDSQNRPEFHRRLLTGALRYRWYKYNRRMQHRLDLIDLNYIFMPWISETFKHDYLDNTSNRNSLLRYNYENLFIMRMGYTYSYVSRNLVNGSNISRRSTYAIRASAEAAGNLLRVFSALTNNPVHDDGYLHFLNIAYAQYVKGDFDYSRLFNLDDRTQVAMHGYLGIAYPYGNSRILPYEKRYFSGGANSVRGWSVRGLGPGSFRGSDGRIDFINQTGDMKMDMSVELRSRLFWNLGAAFFIDAGNIWTLRQYDEQPGGQFRVDTFWKQIAVAYGLGVRLNLGYFVLRLDAGMKAVNPTYEDEKGHYPIIHPNMKRDLAVHFAVGLPF